MKRIVVLLGLFWALPIPARSAAKIDCSKGQKFLPNLKSDLSIEQQNSKGQTHGLACYYWQTGHLHAIIQWKDGKKIGAHEVFHANGKLHNRLKYLDGQLHGRQEYFDQQGEMIAISYFKQGILHGPQRNFGAGRLKDVQFHWQGKYQSQFLYDDRGELEKFSSSVERYEFDKDGRLKGKQKFQWLEPNWFEILWSGLRHAWGAKQETAGFQESWTAVPIAEADRKLPLAALFSEKTLKSLSKKIRPVASKKSRKISPACQPNKKADIVENESFTTEFLCEGQLHDALKTYLESALGPDLVIVSLTPQIHRLLHKDGRQDFVISWHDDLDHKINSKIPLSLTLPYVDGELLPQSFSYRSPERKVRP